MDTEQRAEFEGLAEQMIEFLCNNGHPHMKIIIDIDSAEIVEGCYRHNTQAYIKKAPEIFPGMMEALENFTTKK